MFYVCDKKDNRFGVLDTDDAICEYYTKKDLISISKSINIYGVSNEDIKVLSPDFVKAKAKLLGIDIKNTNWIKKESFYSLRFKLNSDDVLLVEHKTGNILSTKECNLYIKGLKIVNLVNNKFFSSQLVSSNNLMVMFNDILFSIQGFVKKLNTYIYYYNNSDEMYRNGYIEELYRLNTNTIVARYYCKHIPNRGYGCVTFLKIRLDDGGIRDIKLKDEYAYSDYVDECQEYRICRCYQDGSIVEER